MKLVALALGIVLGVAAIALPSRPRAVAFPDGKRFAFSIVDDTDLATVERLRPVYDVLDRHGVRTTKTVWVLESTDGAHDANRGETLRDPEYRAFIKSLQSRGFEIALHGVRGGSSLRADIRAGLDEFAREMGHYPVTHINHSRNRDNLYWGSYRFSLLPLRLTGLMMRSGASEGQDPASAHFWGDLAQKHIRYVRQFTFDEINLMRMNPSMPYRRADTPYANLWFQTSNGANLDAFEALLQAENLDRLEAEGGVCLVYAHLGAGSFNTENGVNPRFEARIRDLVSRNGWFVPAAEILDHLSRQPGWTGDIGLLERIRLETRFTVGRALGGGS